jgi:hypothetical protein
MASGRGRGKTSEEAPEPKRWGGARPVAAALPRLAGPVLGKRGLGEAQLLKEWASIVGADLAEHAMPTKLSFPHGERRDGTLRLRVAPGIAPELQHREPQILERINAFFGYRAVARLALVQGPPLRAPEKRPPAPRPLAPAESAALEQRLAGIADPALRDALERLGRAVIGTSPGGSRNGDQGGGRGSR